MGRDGCRGACARRRRVVAGGLGAGRPAAVRRVRRDGVRAAPGGHGARARRAAAPPRAFVRAAAGGAAHRAPGNQTRVILLAVGLGTFFILGVRGLQANLLRDFSVQVGPDAPDMFLIDVQPDQRDRMAAFLDRRNGAAPAPQADADAAGARRRRRGARREPRKLPGGARPRPAREFTVTYRPHLEANEEVLEGKLVGRRRRSPASRKCRSRKRLPARFCSTTTRRVDRVRSGRAGASPARRARASASARSASAIACASTCSGASSRRASPASAASTGRTSAPADSCSCSGRAPSRQAPHTFISALQGAERRRGARPDAGRIAGAVSQRLGHRPARDPGHDPGHRQQRHARRDRRRRAGAVQRQR